MNSENEICVKTVTKIARSLTKAIIAPTKLTLALSLMPYQLRIPKSIRTTTVIVSTIGRGVMAGKTTPR